MIFLPLLAVSRNHGLEEKNHSTAFVESLKLALNVNKRFQQTIGQSPFPKKIVVVVGPKAGKGKNWKSSKNLAHMFESMKLKFDKIKS